MAAAYNHVKRESFAAFKRRRFVAPRRHTSGPNED
jgi:hypothetical protein